MIQFNLLPEVKIQYVKTQKLKRLVLGVALISSAASICIVLLMFSLVTVQKKHLSDLDGDISTMKSELQNTKDLTKILSVQNQLKSLPALYDGRKAADRLPIYIDQTTPVGNSIGQMSVDFSTNTISMTGTATDLKTLNAYVDTLRYTKFTYKIDDTTQSEPALAFSAVVLTQFGRDPKIANFTINYSFDPALFDITKEITLAVPSLVTTRAEAPGADLFNGVVTPPAEGQ